MIQSVLIAGTIVISLLVFGGSEQTPKIKGALHKTAATLDKTKGMKEKANGAILFRNTMAYDTLNADKFKDAIRNAVEFAQKKAPQLMVQVFIDEKRGLAYSFQLYRNSDDILKHWKVSDKNINEVMKYCEVKKLEVYGNPSKEVIDGILRSVGEDKVYFAPALAGYHQFK